MINGEVLNIPKYDNSSLDGLFSAGLKFIQRKFINFMKCIIFYLASIALDIDCMVLLSSFVFLENHAYDHRRLTLVRYESLALTKPEHKLTMMTSLDAPGSNRISKTEVDEFIVTSQVRI